METSHPHGTCHGRSAHGGRGIPARERSPVGGRRRGCSLVGRLLDEGVTAAARWRRAPGGDDSCACLAIAGRLVAVKSMHGEAVTASADGVGVLHSNHVQLDQRRGAGRGNDLHVFGRPHVECLAHECGPYLRGVGQRSDGGTHGGQLSFSVALENAASTSVSRELSCSACAFVILSRSFPSIARCSW